jgi:hypothetical protein
MGAVVLASVAVVVIAAVGGEETTIDASDHGMGTRTRKSSIPMLLRVGVVAVIQGVTAKPRTSIKRVQHSDCMQPPGKNLQNVITGSQ